MNYQAKASVLGYDIIAKVEAVGDNWHASVVGGCKPHIGSTSFAWPTEDGVQVEHIVRGSHKDHIVGNLFAQELASCLDSAVTVDCGIHYEDLSREEIEQVVVGATEVLRQLLCRVPRTQQE